MKKISLIFLSLSVITLTGCIGGGEDEKSAENNGSIDQNNNSSYYPDSIYKINGSGQQQFTLNGKVMPETTKTIITNNGGIVQDLNCSEGEKVNYGTVIARLKPDFTAPNTKNLVIQRNSLQSQLKNTNSIISSTKSNFKQQISNLKNQIENSKRQVNTLDDNIEILRNQKSSTSGDISTQVKNLQDKISSLEKNLELTKQSRNESLDKINDNLNTLKNQISANTRTFIEDVDKIFGITDKNESKNNSYEDYLGSKDTALKNDVKSKFRKLNKTKSQIMSIPNDEIGSYLNKIIDLAEMAANSVDNSVVSSNLSQNKIDTLYQKFMGYVYSQASISSLKTSFEDTYSTLETTKNDFQTKINDLETQLQSSREDLKNLKNNKISNSLGSIESNINSLKNQISSLENGINNNESRIKTTKQEMDSRLQELENQKLNLQQQIDTINTQLSPEVVKANVNGVVNGKEAQEGNTVNPKTPLCKIIPSNGNSLKIQFYSSNELDLQQQVKIIKNGNQIFTKTIEKELPYKDNQTQNFIYEFTIPKEYSSKFKTQDNVDIKVSMKNKNTSIPTIPLNYLIPQLDNNYIYKVENPEAIKTGKNYNNLNIQKTSIKVGKIVNGRVEVLSGLQKGDIIAR